MSFRITTWNVNSVRLRIDLVKRILTELKPDLLCLQEIKVDTPLFPAEPLAEIGYAHQAVSGMKGYNGVAILARKPFAGKDTLDWCDKTDSRHIWCALANGIEVHNIYVPSGGDVPDPEENDKFAHKLRFLDEVTSWFGGARKPSKPMILVGDLNIAPLEHDVWSHKQLLDVVSHTPIEVEKLTAMQRGLGWVDAVRHFVPASEKLYTWWSYRAHDWQVSNRGRRLDHVWVTKPLAKSLERAEVLARARGWEKASDHVPVTVELDL
ncbi:MAG: exodeoxyribonuclease III [Proteobacteria bacterium]|nr:exodeoxyribonuclease III [Pseudomonadota bacterium]MBI3499725.1 exodeoxyribonuclease III [Pseudomonadota bacterium]